MVSQNTPEFDQQSKGKRTGFKTRAALLGAVGVLALSGAVVNGFIPANAEAPAVDAASPEHAITINPTSFADVVDHVRSAVVSVKVKVTESAENADSDGDGDNGPQQQMPQLKPGDPLERFFKQFGKKGGTQFQKPNKPHSS